MNPILIVEIVLIVAASVVVTLACQNLVCWYFKINQIVSILENIEEHLKILSGKKE